MGSEGGERREGGEKGTINREFGGWEMEVWSGRRKSDCRFHGGLCSRLHSFLYLNVGLLTIGINQYSAKKKDLNKLDFGNTNGVWILRYLKCLLLVNPSNVCAPFFLSLSLLWSFLADPIPRRGDGEGRKEEEGLMSGRKRGEKVEIEGVGAGGFAQFHMMLRPRESEHSCVSTLFHR